MRVLSLIASSTEIIYALDCGDMLVGRSHECDYPSEVKELPFCTEPRFNVEGTSSEIDKRVQSKRGAKETLQRFLRECILKEKQRLVDEGDFVLVQESDLLIVVGARFDDRVTGEL